MSDHAPLDVKSWAIATIIFAVIAVVSCNLLEQLYDYTEGRPGCAISQGLNPCSAALPASRSGRTPSWQASLLDD